ncbi:MAG TPA: biotin--[acetyl-CoA-carboxylase] ligase [Xanthobacteraceae bacterium]|nr:biotin--[acetyl-CoA-carboxylase] ligase [Xanthobacteraceae bacterium]
MNSAALSRHVKTIEYDTIGSTNAEALALARAGEKGPLWVKAARQTAGRGRRGRTWVSERGNLYATLLLSDPAPPHRAAELSFVAALAVFDAVVALAPQLAPRLALKWPNDVLCSGKKFCGILLEGEGPAVAIGIGVNCIHHPEQTLRPATDLTAVGASISAERLFPVLSEAMMQRIAQWNRGAGFDAIRADWLARTADLGEVIRVHMPDVEITGRFEGIEAGGRLIVRLSDGRSTVIAVGDVLTFSGARRPARGAEG